MTTRLMTARYHSAMTSRASSDLDPRAHVLRQFRQVFNLVKTHFQQVERKVGVGGAQVWALSVVRDKPNIGVGELARAMNIHQSTASNLVRALVGRQLLAVAKSASDRRVVQLRLLPAGAKVLKRSPGPNAGVLPTALASLDDTTLRRMEKDLAKLIVLLNPEANAGGTPLAQP
jgi:DNA-binding MarR family transcriptional regulator